MLKNNIKNEYLSEPTKMHHTKLAKKKQSKQTKTKMADSHCTIGTASFCGDH